MIRHIIMTAAGADQKRHLLKNLAHFEVSQKAKVS